MRIRVLALVLLLLSSQALADSIVLKSGKKLTGQITKTTGGWQVIAADGSVTQVKTEDVRSLEMSGGSISPDQAMSNLKSLRRAVENSSDPSAVIERLQTFIDANKNTPAAEEARNDLKLWQDRLDQGLVKLGGKWVSRDKRTKVADQAIEFCITAQPLVQAGQFKEADPLLQSALDLDPACVPALYLRGVMQLTQSQFPQARKSFEAVNTTITGHAPTLNNLAVILWRQNAKLPALNHLEQAMIAAPINKDILDNTTEALALAPDDQKKNPIVARVSRRFLEQDSRLQEIMAANGLYRWGGIWIDQKTLKDLQKNEAEVKSKMAELQMEFDQKRKRADELASQISSIEATINQIVADSYRRDDKGNVIRLPYPPGYFDLQASLSKLSGERAQVQRALEELRVKGAGLESQLPAPKFTGVLKPIGAEGMPVMLPPPIEPPPAPEPTTEPTTIPTTQPTSQPTTEATTLPTSSPVTQSTTQLTTQPTTVPTTEPTAQPTTTPSNR